MKEIGSTYWLSHNTIENLPENSNNIPAIFDGASYVSTCRSAIGIVLDALPNIKRKVALLPAFTCESVLISFSYRGYDIYPYHIRKDLTIDWESFRSDLLLIKPSVILVHSYFGFDTIKELRPHILELKEHGITVIEDETQSMFSCKSLINANYFVGSIRKWMPLPDGAFVTVPIHLEEEDRELVAAKMKALIMKGDWILNGIGEKRMFQQAFRNAENILNNRKQAFKMSSESQKLLSETDLLRMKSTRRDNYKTLIDGILNAPTLSNELQLPISEMEKDDCPFHLPVLVKDGRKDLQQYLAKNNIFATIIWACPDAYKEVIDNDSKYIYDHILCFHIDQRYNQSDMIRIITTLKKYYSA